MSARFPILNGIVGTLTLQKQMRMYKRRRQTTKQSAKERPRIKEKNGDGKVLNGICSDENTGLGVLIEVTVVLRRIVCILELHAK